ncbi:MAG TPA: 3-hydroxyacyl-CoA dehydrogenase family protein [Geminicoccus sp.]|uniref:3-hydroxyacyl-CoA dehydrogenase family protein n=1 Tax=Geminicoccus sp. TaxID=2024832 RepID=UPI002CE5D927|nr:3-hydroxyacyl-CoA dehydrogenase family protein [Geminicoccus sp.]HWL69604.1 3-hydroxyacyl-CoA dehydrogenase family protein [Geminicoccus sp.]
MKQVAVIGAGLMGHALALVFALGGHRVRLTDSNPTTLDGSMALIEKAAATLVSAGEADPSWTPARLSEVITRHETLADTVQGAELIIEAVVELPDVKTALFRELDALAGPDAVFASNTSNLDVFPLIPRHRWKRSLIAHWYSPPYLVDLVDVVPTPETDPAVTAELKAMLEAMGKVPVVFRKFVTGYVANRIQEAIALETYRLLDEGVVTAEEIDQSVIHGLALRMPILGVMGKADFAGLGVIRDNLKNATYQPPEVTGRSESLERAVAAGNTGVRSGKGFYDWGGRTPAELFQDRDNRLLALKKALRDIKPMVPR